MEMITTGTGPNKRRRVVVEEADNGYIVTLMSDRLGCNDIKLVHPSLRKTTMSIVAFFKADEEGDDE